MALPVNIEKLIKGTVVETERIEFKKGWNPEDVIHTMCAFANDINNLGGGYIVIGVEEEDGNPILPPTGLQKNQLDAIQKKLVELSNRIQPTYFAVSEPTKIQGQHIFVLYCPGGDNRPYKAPVSLSDKTRGQAHWIRRYNSTVRANDQEQQKLHELAAKIPFDDRINHEASLKDLKLSLIKEFLQEILLNELGTTLSQVCPKSVPSEEGALIIKNLAQKGASPLTELMAWVGESNRTRFRENYLHGLMDEDLVEFTIPEKPRSSKQKYQLSEKGEELFNGVKYKIE